MARKKAIIILPQLNDRGGNMDKGWYVEYSARNPKTGEMRRFRRSDIFFGVGSKSERYALAKKYIKELTNKLQSGWTPFEKEKVIYEDSLTYHTAARMYGRKKLSNLRINIMINEFIDYKKPLLRKKSLQTYIAKLRQFNVYIEINHLEEYDISALKTEHIESFLRYIAEKFELCRVTLAKNRQILYSFFEYLRKKKYYLEANPVTNIPLPGKIEDHAPYSIPKNERNILAATIQERDRQLWLACCIQYYCALRPGQEVRLLKIRDINIEMRCITVRSDSSKSKRTDTVDMPDQLVEELLFQRIDIYNTDWYVFGPNGQPGERPLGVNTLGNHFRKIRQELGLSDRYTYYSWKHSGAEELADSGASTWEIQAHLRHRSIETTERYTRKRFGQRNDRFKNSFPDIANKDVL